MNHSEHGAGAERAADQIESEREWGGKKKSPRFPLTSNTCTVGANQPPILYTNFNGSRRGERKLAYQGGAAEHPTSSQVFHFERRGINPRAVALRLAGFISHIQKLFIHHCEKSVRASSGLFFLERRQKPASGDIIIPL